MLRSASAATLFLIFCLAPAPLGAQTRPSPPFTATLVTPDPGRVNRPFTGVIESDRKPQLPSSMQRPESPGRGTVILSGLATGIFFGAILGGIHGGSQENCTECDFWGAVCGGFIGGLVGLAGGIVLSR
ncbi:MAG: hypothetical protein OEO79_12905 [Gemmatimonadota bacterium]|nr:hypothetical protein [Gemmatimonadota bacterium]